MAPTRALVQLVSNDVGAVEVGCGNETVELSEACDGGGETASCDDDCTAVACGDSLVNEAAGEACDDGNITNDDGCSSTCQEEEDAGEEGAGDDNGDSDGEDEEDTTCGDGVLQEDEECDDNNITAGDGCNASCDEEHDDLTGDNPEVDFAELNVGQTINLVAPDPTGDTNITSTLILRNSRIQTAAADPESCTCTWSVAPASSGALSTSDSCTTNLALQEAGDATVTVVVECDDGSDTFQQSLTVAADEASAGSSSGCQLKSNPDHTSPNPLIPLGMGMTLLALMLWKRRSASKTVL